MKIIQKILNLIGILLFLMVFFIILCNFNPSISKNIGQLLKQYNIGTGSVSGNNVSGNNPSSGSGASQTPSSQNTQSGSAASTASAVATSFASSSGGLQTPSAGSGYQAPSEQNLQIPSSVSGRTGYTPVQGSGQQIDSGSAKSTAQQVGTGDTGEKLSFNETTYPYYSMLSENLKKLYKQIYANANGLNKTFTPVISVTPDQLKNAFTAVCNDHPEIFWLDTAYSYRYMSDGSAAVLTLQFNQTADQLNSAKSSFEQEASVLTADAATKSTNYDKEKSVHDALIAHVSYNLGADMNQSAYSAIVNGETVCAGYSKAFQYLMQKLGVPCYYCTGYAGESHAWDIIKLDDGFYNVDTTWDDTDPSTYNYFDCSDQDFSGDHIRTDLSVNLPPCGGSKYRKLLAGADSGSSGKSLTDLGLSQSDVLTSLNDYYQNCLKQLDQSTSNPVTFQNVVKDSSMLQQVNDAYNSGDYKNGFGTQALTDKSASSMHMEISVEQLKDGYYLLSHTFTFQ
jgi:hypothetical protein